MRGEKDEIEERGAVGTKTFTTEDTEEHRGESGRRKNLNHKGHEGTQREIARIAEIAKESKLRNSLGKAENRVIRKICLPQSAQGNAEKNLIKLRRSLAILALLAIE